MRAEVVGSPRVPAATLARVATLIAEKLGPHFPPARHADLLRGLVAAARERHFPDVGSYAESLLSAQPSPADFQTLASHLTVSETYFLREHKTLDALSQHILPDLIELRRGRDQHLRLWSAACCTGEEPYSLAILLDQLLPDLDDWRITLLATDLNERALEKAQAGIYGEWSFRAMAPHLRERYFKRLPKNRFALLPEIRERVTFARLNLLAPAEAGIDTHGMDVIFCRNVLMYFAPAQTRAVVRTLHHCLAEGGWLAVSPSECSQTLFASFATVNFPDAILYRRVSDARGRALAHQRPSSETEGSSEAASTPVVPPKHVRVPRAKPKACTSAPGDAVPRSEKPAPASAPAPLPFAARARELANQGRLAEAATWSERWTTTDKIDPAAYYLHATVLQELGELESARRALQSCLYLQPDFALAHFALGNLEHREGRAAESRRHFENARRLLQTRSAEEPLPEAEGLTVGALVAMLTTLLTSTTPDSPRLESTHEPRKR